jgi:hypothetical protein
MRQDLAEYMQSGLMNNPDTISWIYFDNGDPEAEDTPDPLPDVFDTEGNPLENRTQDVYYLNYNHEFSEMQIVENLGELNSDVPETVYNFATKALADCKAAGSTEYFIAFSSHGTGFEGFGGDENTGRHLEGVQTNNDIVSALQSALDDNGIDKFDIVGFDACLMMAYGAVDDFTSVSKYFLASEEVEPGHGKFSTALALKLWSFHHTVSKLCFHNHSTQDGLTLV